MPGSFKVNRQNPIKKLETSKLVIRTIRRVKSESFRRKINEATEKFDP